MMLNQFVVLLLDGTWICCETAVQFQPGAIIGETGRRIFFIRQGAHVRSREHPWHNPLQMLTGT